MNLNAKTNYIEKPYNCYNLCIYVYTVTAKKCLYLL